MQTLIRCRVLRCLIWICTVCQCTNPGFTDNPLCLFVLRFHGPVNPMGSCRVPSVYLTTLLLGRLSPLWLTSIESKLTTALGKSVDGREWPQKIFHNQSPWKNVAGPVGIGPAASWSPVGSASNWATDTSNNPLDTTLWHHSDKDSVALNNRYLSFIQTCGMISLLNNKHDNKFWCMHMYFGSTLPQLSSALSSACDFKSHFCKQCGPRSDCSFSRQG